MTDTKLPDHETLERVLKHAPLEAVSRLPDNTESRRAKDHIALAYDYACQAREKTKTQESKS